MAQLVNKIQSLTLATALGLVGGLVGVFLGLNTAIAAGDPANEAGDDALKLSWTYETGIPNNIAPLIAGDLMLTALGDSSLIALNATTGKVKWNFAPKEGIWDRAFSSFGEQIFVCLKGGKITALNRADGKRQWTADLGINCQRRAHFAGDTIYVSTTFVGPDLPADPLTGAKFFSINMADGKINWSFTTGDFLLQTATSFGDTVYVAGNYIDKAFTDDEGGPARYYALDVATGKVKWIHVSVEGTPKALYATADELVFVAYQDFLYGLEAATGEVIWKRDSENWVPSLVGLGDVVYFGGANTFAHAWSTKTGKPIWRYNIPGVKFDYMLIKPIIDGDRLYFMSQRGFVYAQDRLTGKNIWRVPTGMNSRVGISQGKGHLFMGDKYGRIYGYKIIR